MCAGSMKFLRAQTEKGLTQTFLFGLEANPAESQNLAPAEPEEVARRLVRAREWEGTLPPQAFGGRRETTEIDGQRVVQTYSLRCRHPDCWVVATACANFRGLFVVCSEILGIAAIDRSLSASLAYVWKWANRAANDALGMVGLRWPDTRRVGAPHDSKTTCNADVSVTRK